MPVKLATPRVPLSTMLKLSELVSMIFRRHTPLPVSSAEASMPADVRVPFAMIKVASESSVSVPV